ncbi:MAG TPA: RbsD/FucU family protein [Chloroflexota bacterium]|nr:RbsD/FucU family protein [Chloroflexota bacterium]
MLRTKLLHPGLLEALGRAGHGAKILLADGNYPVSTRSPATATRVYLNLSPGVVSVTDVLAALIPAIPIEAAEVMTPDSGIEPPIFSEFRTLLENSTTALPLQQGGLPLSPLARFAFYDAASQPDVAIAVATGEKRIYANLLLTIGVVDPNAC